MKKLRKKEIQNIGRLLLSPDDKNIELALSLLEHNRYAIPQIRKEVEVYLGFNPSQENLLEWTSEAIPGFKQEKNPVHIFALARNYELEKKYKVLFTEFLGDDDVYEPLISECSNRSKDYAMLGERVYEEWGMEKMKTFFLRKALKYHSNNAKMHWDLAYHLNYKAKINNFTAYEEEIESHYLRCYELHHDYKPIYALALFYEDHMERVGVAEKYYRLGIEQFPNNEILQNGYAMLLFGDKQYERALQYAQMAEETVVQQQIKRNVEHIYDSLGHIYWKGFDDTNQAEIYFDKALTIVKTHKPSLEGAIAMFKEKENWTKMIVWKERLLETNRHNIMLLVELAQDYTHQNDLEQARAYYQKALDIHPHYNIALDGLAALDD